MSQFKSLAILALLAAVASAVVPPQTLEEKKAFIAKELELEIAAMDAVIDILDFNSPSSAEDRTASKLEQYLAPVMTPQVAADIALLKRVEAAKKAAGRVLTSESDRETLDDILTELASKMEIDNRDAVEDRGFGLVFAFTALITLAVGGSLG